MKKLLILTLCALLTMGVAACGTPAPSSSDAPSLSVVPTPPPESSSDNSAQPEPAQQPPIPADAAMYRGTVTALESITDPAASSTDPLLRVTLTQAEGTDFGAPSLQFDFTTDTYADFTPEEGQYLEVYYGRAPGQALDTKAAHKALTAIKYHSAEMVLFNGYIKAIEPNTDKPDTGRLIMVPVREDANDKAELPGEGESSGSMVDPLVTIPSVNEIHYNYDKAQTKFYLDFDQLKVGDRLNIFQSGAMTMSLPPQAFAIEVRPYAEAKL